jgi:esterase/lipase superfamily enzyme
VTLNSDVLHFIARLLVEKVLRGLVPESHTLDDSTWMTADFKLVVPDEVTWRAVSDAVCVAFANEPYLEPIDNNSLVYSLAKAYLNPQLDGEYLIGVVAAYVEPTPAAETLINTAKPAAEPSGQQQQSQPPPANAIHDILRGLYAPDQPPPLPPREEGHRLHAPTVGQSPAEAASERVALRHKLDSESVWSTLIQVYFATDRAPDQYGSDVKHIRGERLRFGACEVLIPKRHKVGALESPSILRLEFTFNPKRHIKLQYTWNYSESTFLEEVATSIQKSSAKDAFIFVHGFNVSFEDAVRRTAQIAFDLNFIGAPILYSWPSNGRMADYMKDETNVAWSAPHFQEFLNLLSQRSGAERIHVIAHSMGNRLVCDAVKSLSQNQANGVKLNHLVLAAPDIDADTFRELAAALNRVSERITLYESSKDKALAASKKLHGNPRAGEPFLILPGVDVIDASAIDTNFLGHSYFSDTWPLLSDIHSILFNDVPPMARFGLSELQHADGVYYAFRA